MQARRTEVETWARKTETEDNGEAEEPGGAKGVEGGGIARSPEVRGTTRVMPDQGEAGRSREPGGA